MAYLTSKESKEISKVLTGEDYREISEITHKRKMKRWTSGYTPMQIRNFALYQHTCSPEMRELILSFVKQKQNVS